MNTTRTRLRIRGWRRIAAWIFCFSWNLGCCAVDPMVAVQSTKLVLDAVSAFSGGDGGMGALLTANLEYSRLISAQLRSVESRLGDLAVQVAKLPVVMEDKMAHQHMLELTYDLRGAAAEFATLIEAGAADPQIWEQIEVRNLLREQLYRIKKSRSTLMQVPNVLFSPEATVLLPIAFALEYSAEMRLGLPVDVRRATLSTYQTLMDALLLEGPNTLAKQMATVINSHDLLIAKLVADGEKPSYANRLPRTFRLQSFRFGQSQDSGGEGVYSFMLFSYYAAGENFDSSVILKTLRHFPLRVSGIIAATVEQQASIKVSYDNVFHVGLLSIERGLTQVSYIIGAKDGVGRRFEGVEPPPNTFIKAMHVKSVKSVPSSPDALIKIARKKEHIAWFDAQAAIFQAELSKLNFHRAQVAVIKSTWISMLRLNSHLHAARETLK